MLNTNMATNAYDPKTDREVLLITVEKVDALAATLEKIEKAVIPKNELTEKLNTVGTRLTALETTTKKLEQGYWRRRGATAAYAFLASILGSAIAWAVKG